MTKKVAVLFITLLLILLFAYAAVTKLADYSNFEFGIRESPFIGAFATVLAWAIPVSELIIAGLLLLPVTRLAGLYASFALMLLFTLYIVVMLLSEAAIPCSCGGVLEEMSWPMHTVFNSIFVLLSALAIILEHRRRKSTSLPANQINNLTYAKRHPAAAEPH